MNKDSSLSGLDEEKKSNSYHTAQSSLLDLNSSGPRSSRKEDVAAVGQLVGYLEKYISSGGLPAMVQSINMQQTMQKYHQHKLAQQQSNPIEKPKGILAPKKMVQHEVPQL